MKDTMRFITVCMALLLVSVTCVTAVSAQQSDDQKVVEGEDIDVGGMELTHTSVTCPTTSIFGISIMGNTVYDWKAGTDIWRGYAGPVESKQYSKSRINGTGDAYDIPKLGVRGRVWSDDTIRFDESDEHTNSADAMVNYRSQGTTEGKWKAQSNHWFEYPANNDFWSPITKDDNLEKDYNL